MAASYATHAPTITPGAGFDPERVCDVLRKAFKGMGTDEKAVIAALTSIDSKQRASLLKQYKVMFGKDLLADIKSELSGNLESLVLAMMFTDAEFDAWSLRNAMSGAGTNEKCLVEILTTRNNSEINAAKAKYTEMFKRDLEKDIVSETSGHLKRILVSLVQASHDESGKVDQAKAAEQAAQLLAAGEKKIGTDESAFNRIFMTSSKAQINAILAEYRKISGYDLERVIEKEMSGDLEDAYINLIQGVRSPAKLFAKLLYKAMKGGGTDDTTLIRIIVSRSEKDLGSVKEAFIDEYKKSLAAWVKGECSGSYETLLLALIK